MKKLKQYVTRVPINAILMLGTLNHNNVLEQILYTVLKIEF